MTIECNNAEVVSSHGTTITVRLPNNYRDILGLFSKGLADKRISQAYVKLGYPRKPRTGPQRGKFHVLCREITKETGEDFASTKWQIKMRAIKRGYPAETGKLGEVLPQSESLASTVEENMLIEECYEVMSWLGIKPKEM